MVSIMPLQKPQIKNSELTSPKVKARFLPSTVKRPGAVRGRFDVLMPFDTPRVGSFDGGGPAPAICSCCRPRFLQARSRLGHINRARSFVNEFPGEFGGIGEFSIPPSTYNQSLANRDTPPLHWRARGNGWPYCQHEQRPEQEKQDAIQPENHPVPVVRRPGRRGGELLHGDFSEFEDSRRHAL